MISLDFETYSEADINKCGAHYYAMHPSTEALMLGYAFNDEPVKMWDIASGEPMPSDLAHVLEGGYEKISAFNAQFERLILKHRLSIEIPPERFECTMVRSYSLSFTGSLSDVLSQFGIDQDKDSAGAALIRRFSKPQPKNHKVKRWTRENDQEGWEEFKRYCKQDVFVERLLRKKLEAYDYLPSERELYALDQKINDRGVPVDRALVAAALEINDKERSTLIDELKDLTGLDNPNSNQQLQQWLVGKGLAMQNMQADTIEREIRRMES